MWKCGNASVNARTQHFSFTKVCHFMISVFSVKWNPMADQATAAALYIYDGSLELHHNFSITLSAGKWEKRKSSFPVLFQKYLVGNIRLGDVLVHAIKKSICARSCQACECTRSCRARECARSCQARGCSPRTLPTPEWIAQWKDFFAVFP